MGKEIRSRETVVALVKSLTLTERFLPALAVLPPSIPLILGEHVSNVGMDSEYRRDGAVTRR